MSHEGPVHRWSPAELLDFIELPTFTRRWVKLGLDDEDDLATLQWSIMANPAGPKLIQGTRAIRKLRFAPPRWRIGKRGAIRVLYVYFAEFGLILLCIAYGKDEVGNISSAVKKYLNKLVDEQERELQRRWSS